LRADSAAAAQNAASVLPIDWKSETSPRSDSGEGGDNSSSARCAPIESCGARCEVRSATWRSAARLRGSSATERLKAASASSGWPSAM